MKNNPFPTPSEQPYRCGQHLVGFDVLEDLMEHFVKEHPVEESRPNHTADTIGVSDNLTPYVKRINAAVGYQGTNDHEDVRSILKDFAKAEKQALLDTRRERLPEKQNTYAPTEYGKGKDDGFNECRELCRQAIKEQMEEELL